MPHPALIARALGDTSQTYRPFTFKGNSPYLMVSFSNFYQFKIIVTGIITEDIKPFQITCSLYSEHIGI